MSPARLAYALKRLDRLRGALKILKEVEPRHRSCLMKKAMASNHNAIKRWEKEIDQHNKERFDVEANH